MAKRDATHGQIRSNERAIDQPYHQVPQRITEHPALTPGAKLAYGVLTNLLQLGRDYPGHETFSRTLAASVRSVVRYFQELQDAELLAVERPGQGLPNRYVLLEWPESLRNARVAFLDDIVARPEVPRWRNTPSLKKKPVKKPVYAHPPDAASAYRTPGAHWSDCPPECACRAPYDASG